MRNKKVRSIAVVALVVGATIAIAVTVFNARYADDVDAMAYIPIAQQYADGNFADAVNGYWSPAVSMLIAPLLYIGLDGRFAFVLINGLAALSIILIGAGILLKKARNPFFANLIFIPSVTLFLISSIRFQNPDLLLAAWTLLFLATVIYVDKNLPSNSQTKKNLLLATLLGFVCFIGYMIKLYALPFFIGTVAIWFAVRALTNRSSRKKTVGSVAKTLLLSMKIPALAGVAFIIISIPWVTALSVKYGYVTLGSSATVNVQSKFNKPKTKTKQAAASVVPEKKIISPSSQTATTIIQDLTPKRTDEPATSSGEKVSTMQKVTYYLKGRVAGIPPYIKKLNNMWIGFFIVFIVIVAWAYRYWAPSVENRYLYIVLTGLIVYFLGYSLLAGPTGGNVRYYWPMMIMSLLLASLFLSQQLAHRQSRIRLISSTIAALAVVVSVFIQYLSTNVQALKKTAQIPTIQTAADQFVATHSPERYADYTSNNIRRSNEFVFYADGQSHKGTTLNINDAADIRLMKDKGIDYYLLFSEDRNIEKITTGTQKVIDSYYLGDRYYCKNARLPQATQCTLYIVQINR